MPIDKHLLADVEPNRVDVSESITAYRLVGNHLAIEKEINGRKMDVILSDDSMREIINLPKWEADD